MFPCLVTGGVEAEATKGNQEFVSQLEKSRMKKRSLERELAAWKTGTSSTTTISRRNSTGSYDELPALVDCDEPEEPRRVLERINEASYRGESRTQKIRSLSLPTGVVEDDTLHSHAFQEGTVTGVTISSPESLPPLVDCDDSESEEDENKRRIGLRGSYSRTLTNVNESSVEGYDDESVTITIKTQRANLSHLLSAIKNHGTTVTTLSSTLDEEESIFSMAEFPPQGTKQVNAPLGVPKEVTPKKKRGRSSSMGSAAPISTGLWIAQLFDQGARRQEKSSRESLSTQCDIETISSKSCSESSKSDHRFPKWSGNRRASIGSMTPMRRTEPQLAVREKNPPRDNPKALNLEVEDPPRPSSQTSLGKLMTQEKTCPNRSKSNLTSSTRSITTSNSSKCSSFSQNSHERSSFNRDGIKNAPSSRASLSIGSRDGKSASTFTKPIGYQKDVNENKVKEGTEEGDPETMLGLKTTLKKPSSRDSPQLSSMIGVTTIDWNEDSSMPRWSDTCDSTDFQLTIRQQRRGSTGGYYLSDSRTCKESIDADFLQPAATVSFAHHLDSKHIRRMSRKIPEHSRSSSDIFHESLIDLDLESEKCLRHPRRHSTGCEYPIDLPTICKSRKVEEHLDAYTISSSPNVVAERQKRQHRERRTSTGGGFLDTSGYHTSAKNLEAPLDGHHVRNLKFASGGNRDSSPSPYARQCLERRKSSGSGHSFESPYASYPRELGQQLDSRQFHQSSTPSSVCTQGSPNLAPITMALRKEAILQSFSRNDSRLSLHSGIVEHSSPPSSQKFSKPSRTCVGAPNNVHVPSPDSPSKVKSRLISDYNNSQQLDGLSAQRSKSRIGAMHLFRKSKLPGSTSQEKQKSSRAARQASSRSMGEKAQVDSPARTDDQSKHRVQRRASTGSSSAYSTPTPPLKTSEGQKILTVEKKGGKSSRLSLGLLRGSKNNFSKSKRRWN